MRCYVLERPLALQIGTRTMERRGAADPERPAMDEVYVASQNELSAVRAALAQAYPETPAEEILRIYAPQNVPALLGVRPFVQNHRPPPPMPLIPQLYGLKAAHRGGENLRLLVINGFGTNLGDNLIGLSAFAHVLERIRSVLPEAAVDVMLGWHGDDRLERLYRGAGWEGEILTEGITLAGLSDYRGIFDFGELLSQPRYGSMPMVDWYLWWMGLDPSAILAKRKRNAISIPEPARRSVAAGCLPYPGVRILINPAASTPLRSMPDAYLMRLVASILESWPQARIVLMRPCGAGDPRVQECSPADVDELAALLERCDALIGVDTYTQHLADALSVPAVTLFTSVPPDLYPYYPLNRSLMIPGAERLPAWGKAKVSAGAWKLIGRLYGEAWMEMEPGIVLGALEQVWSAEASPSDNPAC